MASRAHQNSGDEHPASAAEPARNVLVLCEASGPGRAALAHAETIASASGAGLTVLAVVEQERTDVGCASCRHSAFVWNRELRAIGNEELEAAATQLAGLDGVRFELAIGAPAQAIRAAADRCGADVVVLPWRRPARVRRRRSADWDEQLRLGAAWRVVVAPPE